MEFYHRTIEILKNDEIVGVGKSSSNNKQLLKQIDKIELINSAGSIVKSQKFTSMSNEQSGINISALENGFYILNVSGIAQQKNYKILIQHE